VGAALVHAGLAETQLSSSDDLRQARQAVATVKHQMMRLDSILERVLRLAADESEPPLRREIVDLSDLVPCVVQQLTLWRPEAREQISLRFEGDLLGEWDVMALAEVVTNLIGNALKFGESRPVQVSVRSQDAMVQIDVRDHGIGIAPQDQRKIFERFRRGVPPRSFGGLGLGLWIVRTLVKAHGGSVRVASVPGRGSLFTVRLPRFPARAASGEAKGRGALTADARG